MTIDKYQPCPCGSGKKIKFCCSADIVGELEKIQRMLEGDQRQACLDYVVKLLQKHPDRPSLLSIKAMLENELGEAEQAEETISALLEKTPESPNALAEQAVTLANKGDAVKAAHALQKAIDAAGSGLPARLYDAIGDVAVALLDAGEILAARAHFLLHATLGGEDDPRSAGALMELNASDRLPLLMKQDTRLVPCPDDAPYKSDFDTAMQLVSHAQWAKAVAALTSLTERHGREPALWRNIAILRGFIGESEAAAAAWRRYAALCEADALDDAVEAEALAQLLSEETANEQIDVVDVTYEVKDLEQLMELVLGSRRLQRLPVDLQGLTSDDSPPPKGVFSLLDREMPSSSEGLEVDSVPDAWCDVFVYGRETDRPARLELTVPRSTLTDVKQALAEIAGEQLSDAPKEVVVGETDELEQAMTWSWRLPDDTPRELRTRLAAEKRRHILFDVWPTVPHRVLDGKTPQEAAGDPKYRVRLLAAILLLELHGQQSNWQVDYDQLRAQLGLPKAEAIDPWKADLERLPLVRFHRLDAMKLKTDRLGSFFQYAAMMRAVEAMRRLGKELVGRDDLDKNTRIDVYGVLARVAANIDESIDYVHQARETAVAEGQSAARWLLAELPLAIQQQNSQRAQQLIEQLQSRHQHEPGVMQSLVNILASYGLIQPGAAAGPAAPAAAAAPAAPASAAGGEGIWTPGSGPAASPPPPAAQAEASGAEKKSKLWIPGMD